MTQVQMKPRRSPRLSCIGSLGLTIAVGVVYFLAARLGLALITKPEGVAVFWPASGIAVGMLIALGYRVRVPVTVGVVAASSAASLLGDRNLAAASVLALCNGGEALLVAWLIKRHFGKAFRLETVRSVFGFFAAAGVGAATSGIGATAGFVFFYGSGAPLSAIWLNWFASDALGIFTVAPVVIGFARALQDVPTTRGCLEGMLAVVVLFVVSTTSFVAPSEYWFTMMPLGLLLPLLLWPAARCQPVFAAAAVSVLAFVIVLTTTFGVGKLGDASSPLADRVHAARASLLVISMCGFVLAAIFAERRHYESALKDSNDRLHLALNGAGLGVWSVDARTGRFESDVRDQGIHGYSSEAPPKTVAEARNFIHSDDLPCFDRAFADARHSGGNCKVEYRIVPSSDRADDSQDRWAAVEGTLVRDAAGQPLRWLGVTRDITERKHSDEKVRRSEKALRERLGALPAAVYVTDASGYITYFNAAALELWGLAPELGKSRFCGAWKIYLPDGTPMAHEECPMALTLKQRRPIRDAEAIAERPDGTRTPVVAYPTPLFDAAGTLTGGINMLVDISERKRAERAIAERNTQLALAGKVALVGSFTFDIDSGEMQTSPGYAAIHALPEGTEAASRSDWRTRVHPDDLPRLDARLQQAITAGEREHFCEYRILHPSGELRYIESRSSISYDQHGTAQRIIGTNIDVTEHKRAEAQVTESANRLADALTAGDVIAFEWDAVTRQSRRSGNAAIILGYDENSAAGWQRSDFLERIHPDDREGCKKRVRELRPGNPSYAVSFRFHGPDGGLVWLEETAKGEFDGAGQLLRIKGLTRNITERKKAECALAERDLQLSLAGKAAGVGSYAYDLGTDRIQISEGYAALHGLPEGTVEIRRSQWRTRVHPEDRDRFEEVRSRAFAERRGEYGAEYRVLRSEGDVRWIESRSFISYDRDWRPQRVIGVNIDISERKRAEEQQRVLVGELDHRVKNVLATISAVAAHTLDASSSMDHFVAALDGRIRSMASTHELLSRGRWHGVPLVELVRCELAPYVTKNNADIGGPDVLLSAEAGQAIASVFHELATNAAKYGALSARSGKVSVMWYWPTDGKSKVDRLVIEWREMGGPQVKTPQKSGYGRNVIADLVPYELGGTTDLMFCPDGVRCRLDVPARCVGIGRLPTKAEGAIVPGPAAPANHRPAQIKLAVLREPLRGP